MSIWRNINNKLMIGVINMQKKVLKIENIPAVIWGDMSERVIIAIHGNMSNKMDVPIEMLAKNVLADGYQVLSFDLPEHGDRRHELTPCKVQYCVSDLTKIMKYAKKNWKHISIFANSIGAYFSLLAYRDEPIEKAWFLSPVVDMQRIIGNMMTWFNVTEDRLKREQTVSTPIGQKLYWDYYCYVNEHPIHDWHIPTTILYGSEDDMCDRDTISNFVEQFPCELEIIEGGEHYFHTPEQLNALNSWLKKTMCETEPKCFTEGVLIDDNSTNYKSENTIQKKKI
jgi:esterase/lipase